MNGCTKGFSWCSGGSPDCHGDHQAIAYTPSTLGEGTPFRLDDDQEQLLIGAGIHYNEREGDSAPRVIIHIQGGPQDLDVQVDLRLGEAHDLEELLLRANEHAAAVMLASVPKYFKEIVLPDASGAR
ncbi:hypothetical protein P5V78_12850 [Mycobacteroides abscessus subsp. abscessus]|uniref:hypothetical protein n=1 Tax=Mycobacteroides abscessus TaxID=36809 RepID=UPI00092A6224|nr:hypothetical protein [Mycobacteroides abscessus]MBN7402841.1 hypothetical protein [Mycobacteroides abscessus subsp. abscessus]MDO3088878.1 hypothetical protein [Mycobacteroides abscessus subsp. abscessus]MDO3270657.1 hypothetical protein [Mycobacteroides abscessus subsp. abscessus]SHQ37734.1 Uncharacterised protein [Mycobacteroides abscessus subsp. abscessus]SHY83294.1 Uncharacterised protein [Mycobacteroides abscessus subsp. abscessus]